MRTNLVQLVTLVAIALAPMLPSKVSAGPVVQGGTEIEVSSTYFASRMYGYDFVSNTNQLVTALGFWDFASDSLPRSFQVGLWVTATQTLASSVVIDNTDPIDPSVTIAGGQYRYEALTVPVPLLSGTTYTLGWQLGTPLLSNSDALFINYPSLVSDPSVSVANQFRSLNNATFTFPTDTGAGNSLFPGMVNAQLSATAPIPEPSTYALMLAGLGIVVFVAKRQRSGEATG